MEQDSSKQLDNNEDDKKNKKEVTKKSAEEAKKQDELNSEHEDSNHALPSAKLLLSAAQKENDYEIDRKKTLETRAGIFVAFSGVLFTLITKTMDFNIFKNVQPVDFIRHAVIFGLFFLIPFLLLLVSVYCFFHVIIVKKYDRFVMDGFDGDTAKKTEEEVSLYLMEMYRNVVNVNANVNDKKSVYFFVGVITMGVAAALIAVMYLIAFIL